MKLKLALLAFANIAYWLFLGPALISASNWIAVAVGVTAGVAVLYYNWQVVVSAKSLLNETPEESKE